MENMISIAKILNFHGIKGEVKLGYPKGKEDLLEKLKTMYLPSENNFIELNIKYIKFSKNIAIVKFKEFNSINDIMPYKNVKLYIKKDILEEKLSEDEYLIEDLIGLKVFDNSEEYIGIVNSISSNGATDILCIKPKNNDIEQFLVPFVADLVPIVDIKKGIIIIKPIEGLLE